MCSSANIGTTVSSSQHFLTVMGMFVMGVCNVCNGDVCAYPSIYWRAEKIRVPEKRNEYLFLYASSSDKCISSDHGQETGREANNLR